jgi:TIGR03009 family protein
MTRLFVCICLFAIACPAVARAQTYTNPAAAGRYAPQGKAAAQPQQPVRQAQATGPIVQPTAGSPAAGPQPGIAPVMPQQPEWAARMTLDEQKWLDEVLRFWESRSDKVQFFGCKFQRWDYDGGFVGADQKWNPRTYAEGTIKYGQPDKGLYKVEKLVSVLPGQPGQPPQQVVQNAEQGEHWICDGQRIFSFEASKKQVTETPLPPEMRGKAIADGPLPFMFGAKAETIKARYWIHGLVAAAGDKSKEGKYWLEAVPKSRQDAQNFKMVRIVLDQQDYLPESLEVFAPNYDPPRNNARQAYVFSERKAEDEKSIGAAFAAGVDPLKLFHREFFEPRVPLGWKKVVDAGGVPAGPAQPQQAGPAPPAQRQSPLPR